MQFFFAAERMIHDWLEMENEEKIIQLVIQSLLEARSASKETFKTNFHLRIIMLSSLGFVFDEPWSCD